MVSTIRILLSRKVCKSLRVVSEGFLLPTLNSCRVTVSRTPTTVPAPHKPTLSLPPKKLSTKANSRLLRTQQAASQRNIICRNSMIWCQSSFAVTRQWQMHDGVFIKSTWMKVIDLPYSFLPWDGIHTCEPPWGILLLPIHTHEDLMIQYKASLGSWSALMTCCSSMKA